MKLNEAFAKINNYEFDYINEEDIRYYMCCIYDGKPIIYNGIKFFIDAKSLKDWIKKLTHVKKYFKIQKWFTKGNKNKLDGGVIMEVKINLKKVYNYQALLGLSDSDFSKKMGIQKSAFSRVKSGERNPGKAFITGLIKAGMNVEDIFIKV